MSGSTTRRSVIAAAGAASAAVTLAACGGGESGESSGSEENAGGGGEKGGGAAELGSASDIPEGGGKVFKDQKVVVTRPGGSDYKAFSATCTHQGCSVADVKGGTINCPCHDSKFDITDGSVKGGPATKPLPPAKISVEGGKIHLADS